MAKAFGITHRDRKKASAMTENDFSKVIRRADQALVIITLSIAGLIVSVSLLLR